MRSFGSWIGVGRESLRGVGVGRFSVDPPDAAADENEEDADESEGFEGGGFGNGKGKGCRRRGGFYGFGRCLGGREERGGSGCGCEGIDELVEGLLGIILFARRVADGPVAEPLEVVDGEGVNGLAIRCGCGDDFKGGEAEGSGAISEGADEVLSLSAEAVDLTLSDL